MAQRHNSVIFRLMILLNLALVLCLWVVLDLPCPLRRLTGIPCPSCGMSRAWLAALKLDFVTAFSCHPLFWSVPVLAVFFILGDRAFQKIRNLLLPAFLLAYVSCYILRLSAYLKGVTTF